MAPARSTSTRNSEPSAPALLWHPAESGAVWCDLCAHRCRIPEGHAGICQVRVNEGGALKTLVLNRLVAAASDPIEKKPLFHFLPGSRAFSIATAGCNFRCRYCQNWQISQAPRRDHRVEGEVTPPEAVVAAAERFGCATIAYTYTEPVIFFETAESVGRLARERGLKNAFVTNGYMTAEAVERARTFLDAANVDLKGFDDGRYRSVCGASLKGVLEGLEALLDAGVWVEVTTLVVPGMNDSEDELRALTRHLAGLGAHIPWHISRYHPDYEMLDVASTPMDALKRAYEIGREAGLRFVYVGNVPGHEAESTPCPDCGTMVVIREGFSLSALRLREGCCPTCGVALPGVWSP